MDRHGGKGGNLGLLVVVQAVAVRIPSLTSHRKPAPRAGFREVHDRSARVSADLRKRRCPQYRPQNPHTDRASSWQARASSQPPLDVSSETTVAPAISFPCPACGGRSAMIYVAPRDDGHFPAQASCECESCQGEWSILLTPDEVVELARSSGVSIDWSDEWSSLRARDN